MIGAAIDALVLQARAAADAGLDLFQIRETAFPDSALPDSALLDLAGRVRDAAAGSALRVLINDRLDIAIAACTACICAHRRFPPRAPAALRRRCRS